MLRWANRRSFFRCVHVGAGFLKERRLWLDACVQSFVSPFASKASSLDTISATHVKLSASKVSRRKSNSTHDVNVSGAKVHRQHAHDDFTASGEADIFVHYADRQDVDVQFCKSDNVGMKCNNQDAKGHSVGGDAKVFESVACMPRAQSQSSNGIVRGAESGARLKDDNISASSSKLKDKCLLTDVSNVSCKSLSLHVSLQALVIQTGMKSQKDLAALQQKIELLESEGFSLSYATMLVKRRAFKSCSIQQLERVLQVLKHFFPSAKVVHHILVGSFNVLRQQADLVQQKLKLLFDFQVEEKVVSKLCVRGKALSISLELLQERLTLYKDIGLDVEARNMMFFKGPRTLSLSIENNVQPALNFFESTGLTKNGILYLVQRCPEVFQMSLDQLIKKYEYFKQLGFSIEETHSIFRCARRFSIKTIEEHMQSLKDMGFTDHDVRMILKRQPTILCCSPKNVKSKVDFLISEQNRDMAEILHDPNCLTYSLQGRIIPRFNAVTKLCSSKVYSLPSILNATDSTFLKRFGKEKESSSLLLAGASATMFS